MSYKVPKASDKTFIPAKSADLATKTNFTGLATKPNFTGLADKTDFKGKKSEKEEKGFFERFFDWGGSLLDDDDTSPSQRAASYYDMEEEAFRSAEEAVLYREQMGITDARGSLGHTMRQNIEDRAPEIVTVPRLYKVVGGDNLTDIAKANGTTVEAILSVNPEITNRHMIEKGQEIILPSAESSSVTDSPLVEPTPVTTPPDETVTPTGAGLMSPRFDIKGETVPIPTWQKTLGKPIFNSGSFSQNNLSEAISSSGIGTEESAILRGAFETEVGDRGPVTETGYSRQNVIDMGPTSTWGRRMVRDGVMNADGTLTNLYSGDNVFNSVYANRNGNGDFASGDGARYKGRGLIQITGRDNYQEVQNRLSDLGLEVDLMSNPDLVNNEKYALPAALALLDHLGVNESTIPTMSAKGLNNAINSKAPVATAEERWENVVDILTEDEEQELATAVSNRNEYAAQRTVGTPVDGSIGPNSVRAMRSWLTRNNVAIPEDATNLDLVILVNENS